MWWCGCMSWEWGVCCVLCRMRLGYVVVWQHVLGVACVLCAVQNETRLCDGVAACLGSGVCVVCCAE
jgi:hypothetical protein